MDDETLLAMRREVTPHLEYLQDIGVIKSFSFGVAPDVVLIEWTDAYARLLKAGRSIEFEPAFAQVSALDDPEAIRAWIEREADGLKPSSGRRRAHQGRRSHRRASDGPADPDLGL